MNSQARRLRYGLSRGLLACCERADSLVIGRWSLVLPLSILSTSFVHPLYIGWPLGSASPSEACRGAIIPTELPTHGHCGSGSALPRPFCATSDGVPYRISAAQGQGLDACRTGEVTALSGRQDSRCPRKEPELLARELTPSDSPC